MKTCCESGCQSRAIAKGLCNKHYQRQRLLELRKDPEAWSTYAASVRQAQKRYQSKPEAREKKRQRSRPPEPYNPEKGRARQALRRSKKQGVDHTALVSLFDHLRTQPCSCCGRPPPSAVDHILPLSWARGCEITQRALAESWCYQPLCKSCNSSKGARGVWAFVPTGTVC